MLFEVHNLLRLYLTVHITLATSERSSSALRRVLTYGSSRRTFQFLFPNFYSYFQILPRNFAYLKIPIKPQLVGFKDQIDRFQFQLPTKLVSFNSLFPIPFLARGPLLIFIRLFLFQISILTCAYTIIFILIKWIVQSLLFLVAFLCLLL